MANATSSRPSRVDARARTRRGALIVLFLTEDLAHKVGRNGPLAALVGVYDSSSRVVNHAATLLTTARWRRPRLLSVPLLSRLIKAATSVCQRPA